MAFDWLALRDKKLFCSWPIKSIRNYIMHNNLYADSVWLQKYFISRSTVPNFPFLALRSLRTLRSISFSRGLQVLVTALIQTFRNALLHLLFLLFILMFLFSIMGHYLFGYEEGSDQENWGTFGNAMLSLFNYVTVSFYLNSQAHYLYVVRGEV